MTINLFDVQDALDAEDKDYIRLKQVRERALRQWGKEADVVEGANNALESGSQPEAQKSSNLA